MSSSTMMVYGFGFECDTEDSILIQFIKNIKGHSVEQNGREMYIKKCLLILLKTGLIWMISSAIMTATAVDVKGLAQSLQI